MTHRGGEGGVSWDYTGRVSGNGHLEKTVTSLGKSVVHKEVYEPKPVESWRVNLLVEHLGCSGRGVGEGSDRRGSFHSVLTSFW